MRPTPSDVHVNAALTNISIAYIQKASNFVATQVFPLVPVAKQSDRYYVYDRAFFNRDEMARRAPATESAGGHYSVDNTPSYYADVWAFHHDVPDQRRANADSVLEPDREATEICTLKGLIRREKLFAANFMAASKWGKDITGVSGTPSTNQVKQWNDAAATPIEDVITYKTYVLGETGFEPNVLVVGQQVHDKLIRHPDVVEIIKYSSSPGSPAIATPDTMAKVFGVEKYLVMKSIENTAMEGQANVGAFIGGKKALLVYAASSPSLMTPSGGYTFSWTGYLGAGADGQRISRFRMEPIKSDRVEIEMAMDLKLTAAPVGVYFASIVA